MNNCAALAEPVAAIATAQANTAALNMDTIDFSFKQKETHKATAYTVKADRKIPTFHTNRNADSSSNSTLSRMSKLPLGMIPVALNHPD
jgi:hypothetical protein